MYTPVLCLIINAQLYFYHSVIIFFAHCSATEGRSRLGSSPEFQWALLFLRCLFGQQMKSRSSWERSGLEPDLRDVVLHQCAMICTRAKKGIRGDFKSSFYSWMDNTRSGSKWAICLKHAPQCSWIYKPAFLIFILMKVQHGVTHHLL